MEHLNFELAQEKDLDAIFGMFAHTIAQMNHHKIPQWDEVYPCKTDLWEDIQKQQLYIGKINNQIAVAYVLNQQCDEAYKNGNWQYPHATYYVIHRLCVSNLFQNQGIGSKTVAYIEKQVCHFGGETIHLDAFTLNPSALNLYDKLGYKSVGVANLRKGEFLLMEKKVNI